MFREEILSTLVAELKSNDLILSRKARIYVFGSILRKSSAISDVDIAVIVRPSTDLRSIKTSLDALGRYFPLDVIYMTDVEEEEFEFLAGQQAVNMFNESLAIDSTRSSNSSLRYKSGTCELCSDTRNRFSDTLEFLT